MKRNFRQFGFFIISFFIIGFLLIGCTTTIPVTSNINDFVMMGLKTNRSNSVSLEIISSIIDGEIVVSGKDGEGTTGKVIVNEGSAITKMLNEYMSAKFTKLSDKGDVQIKISLLEFSLQDYNTQGTGLKILGSITGSVREPRIVTAKIKAVLDITRNGKVETKNLIASSEENYIGEFTSEVSNRAVAHSINSANNKILMQINSYFEEIGL